MFKQADLLKLAESNGIKIEKHGLPAGIKSIYTELKECPVIICLNKQLTSPECTVELAVCLGFYFTRSENNPSSSEKRTKAEDWAYTHLVPVETFTQAFASGAADIAGIAEYASLTPDFIRKAAQFYAGRLGSYITIGSFCVIFEPLSIVQKF